MQHVISGKVREKESGLPVVGIHVRAYDKDLIYDDLLGSSVTDQEGSFQMRYEEKDYQEIFEGDKPEIYLNLLAGPRNLIARYSLEELKPEKTREGQHIELLVDREKLGAFAPVRPEGFPATHADVSQRKTIEARADLPENVSIELGRIWRAEQEAVRTERDEQGNLLITKKFDLKRLTPPSIRFEALHEKNIGDLLQPEVEGFIPDHLPIKFAPQVLEQLHGDIKDGEDRPLNVFPPDTRYVFNDISFPWCTTGRVETPGGGVCTGTMVGRNLMLTASHCIDWQDDSVGWIKFTPSYYNGSAPFGVAWGTRVLYWNRAQGGLTNFETAFDYVIVVLDRNIGDLTGYTGYRKYASSWNNGNYWQVIGYPGSLTSFERPTFSGGGSIWHTASYSSSGREGLVMGTFIDLTPGNSGGPVWGWWDDEPWPRVVGVVSSASSTPGFSTSGDNEAGGGEALSALISYGRNNY